MIKNVDNVEKHGSSLEVILEDVGDVVSMMVNGIEIVIRYNDEGVSVDAYDDTTENERVISEKFHLFEGLSGKWED